MPPRNSWCKASWLPCWGGGGGGGGLQQCLQETNGARQVGCRLGGGGRGVEEPVGCRISGGGRGVEEPVGCHLVSCV